MIAKQTRQPGQTNIHRISIPLEDVEEHGAEHCIREKMKGEGYEFNKIVIGKYPYQFENNMIFDCSVWQFRRIK